MRNTERDSHRKGEDAPKLHQNLKSPDPAPRLSRQRLARVGEASAAAFLQKAGYRIREMNWRAGRFSEIDIIALDPTGNLVFVEVKTRYVEGDQERRGFFNAGFENINWRKKQKLMTTAQMYLSAYATTFDSCRFEAIVVYYPQPDQSAQTENAAAGSFVPQIRHVKNIFE